MMINLSDEVIYSRKPLKQDLFEALSIIRNRLPITPQGNQRQVPTFEAIFAHAVSSESPRHFINDLVGIVTRAETDLVRVLHAARLKNGRLTVAARSAAVMYARSILLQLWEARIVLLPMRMTYGSPGKGGFREHLKSQVVAFLCNFTPDATELREFGSTSAKRLNSECWKWIHATSWIDIADINLEDAVGLRIEESRRANGGNPSPLRCVDLFVKVGLRRFPSEFPFSLVDWRAAPVGLAPTPILRSTASLGDIAFQKLALFRSVGTNIKINPHLLGTEYEFQQKDGDLF